jgi:hypothetical protein
VALVAGVGSKAYLKEFSGKDLEHVDRVICDVGNPMSKTISGKMAIADTLVERGLIKSPEQYIQMLETGRLEPLIESESMELMNIRSENEVLSDSETAEVSEERQIIVKAFLTDNHALHIREHAGIISSPDARSDVNMFNKVWAHIQEHIQLLRQTDPGFLMLNGQQPLPPLQVAPPVPNQDIANTPTTGQTAQPTTPGEQTMPGAQPKGAELPNMPNMPKNPMTGEEFNNQDGGLPQ